MLAFRKQGRKVRVKILQRCRPRLLATAVPLHTFLLGLSSEFVFLMAFDKLQRWQPLS